MFEELSVVSPSEPSLEAAPLMAASVEDEESSISIEELAKQKPELQKLLNLLNSQNITYEQYVANDPEFAATMKLLTEDNIASSANISDEEIDSDVEATSFDPEDGTTENALMPAGAAPVEPAVQPVAPAPVTTQFTENTSEASAVSDDLNSIF